MTIATDPVADDHHVASGDEAGTPPSDRRFRPDVEGLRAVAVLLVVLFHAGVPHLTGGYVGVDVFFVISGFVITGLLLRERKGTGRTSILDFYARRVRRILPAATLVILVTVAACYLLLGVVSGNNTADDGRWAAIFLANFHFEAIGTNYLAASRPPSPLQNYWSLSVEEQFYVVYPTLFLLMARTKGRLSLQVKLAIALGIVIASSYWLSIVQTGSHPAAAYFSPFTRAWELALGALIAVGTPWLKRIPGQGAGLVTWVGLAAIVFAAFAFNAQTAYPGSLVAVPVIGAGLVIAGGVAIPRAGAESLLGLGPFQWLGKRSYSLYLLHWPILVIAAERVGKTSLPLWENLTLVGVALLLSMWSYVGVENRIRHWRLPSRRSVALGVGTAVATVAVLTAVIAMGTTPTRGYTVTPVASTSALRTQVAAARSITRVPADLTPSLTQYGQFWGGNYEDLACQAAASQWKERICTLGDPMAKRLMVVYGDSYALMWLPAFNAIARSAHWRLIVLSKPYCPAEFVTIVNQPSYGTPNGPDTVCNQWHTWALNRINAIKPSLLVITQLNEYETPGTATSPPALFPVDEWSSGLTDLLQAIRVPNVRKVFLGGTPGAAQLTPTCLANHLDDVQACSGSASNGYNPIERQAAISSKTEYVDTNPWYCTTICTPIIEKYCVYLDGIHITSVWAIYLQNVLAAALGIHFESTSSTYVLGTP